MSHRPSLRDSREVLYHWATAPGLFLVFILRQNLTRLLGLALNSLCISQTDLQLDILFLQPLKMTGLRLLHWQSWLVLLHGWIVSGLLWMWIYIYIIFSLFIQPWMGTWLDFICELFSVANGAIINMGMQGWLWYPDFISFGYINQKWANWIIW